VEIDTELKNLIRPLRDDEFEKLKESILSEGIRDPLVTWNGILLDGFHRYKIAQEYGLEYKTVEIELPDKEAAKEWIYTNQLGRRNLTVYEASYYRGRLYESRKLNYDKNRDPSGRFVRLGNTAEEIGKEYGLSEKTIRRDAEFSAAIDKVATEVGEEARRAILLGQANVPKKDIEVLIEVKQKAPEFIEPILNGEIEISKVVREIRRKDRIENTPTMPNGNYNVLYADPPWRYDFGFDIHGAADRHYHTMTIEELCELPIADLSEDNAVLFMWVTSPKLFDAKKVIDAWGFDYKTSFIWDKVKHVMGHYNSVRHEILLVCVRGSFPKQNNTLHDSVISIERTDEHSEKPEYFRHLIEEMYPNSKKIELFARKRVDGWDAWGNEL
jgi:N6-adenosine-specific RNA methylase IME4/ParB-like chromosome segregation protein Spo0J